MIMHLNGLTAVLLDIKNQPVHDVPFTAIDQKCGKRSRK
jgi:hypothetical protein